MVFQLFFVNQNDIKTIESDRFTSHFLLEFDIHLQRPSICHHQKQSCVNDELTLATAPKQPGFIIDCNSFSLKSAKNATIQTSHSRKNERESHMETDGS